MHTNQFICSSSYSVFYFCMAKLYLFICVSQIVGAWDHSILKLTVYLSESLSVNKSCIGPTTGNHSGDGKLPTQPHAIPKWFGKHYIAMTSICA